MIISTPPTNNRLRSRSDDNDSGASPSFDEHSTAATGRCQRTSRAVAVQFAIDRGGTAATTSSRRGDDPQPRRTGEMALAGREPVDLASGLISRNERLQSMGIAVMNHAETGFEAV